MLTSSDIVRAAGCLSHVIQYHVTSVWRSCDHSNSRGEMADQIPPALKSVQPYLTIAKQFAKRDPVVAYYGEL